jgi:hypothetical protein
MRPLKRFVPVAIAVGVLLVAHAAEARGSAGGRAPAFRAAAVLAARQARLAGLRSALAVRRLPPSGFGPNSAIARQTTLSAFAAERVAPFRFGFDRRDLFGRRVRRYGVRVFPWGWGWGLLGAGWWALGWDFPWDWQGFAGPCYQWIYPPGAPPYCAPPYPSPIPPAPGT